MTEWEEKTGLEQVVTGVFTAGTIVAVTSAVTAGLSSLVAGFYTAYSGMGDAGAKELGGVVISITGIAVGVGYATAVILPSLADSKMVVLDGDSMDSPSEKLSKTIEHVGALPFFTPQISLVCYVIGYGIGKLCQ